MEKIILKRERSEEKNEFRCARQSPSNDLNVKLNKSLMNYSNRLKIFLLIFLKK